MDNSALKVICGLLMFSIIQMGCSSSFMVSSSVSAGGSSRTFRVEANGERDTMVFGRATIVFQDNGKVDAQDVMAAPDSTSFLNVTTGLRSVVPTDTIEKIVSTDRFFGFLEGWGIGLLAGAGAGLLAAAIAGGSNAYGFVGLIIVGVCAGGLVGIPTGLILGHTYEYKFVHESKKP